MERIFVIGASKVVDGKGSLEETEDIVERAQRLGLQIVEYHTATSEMRWKDKLPENYLKSACSPMQAILKLDQLFLKNEADIVVLTGKDHIRSKYLGKKEERNKHFQIYGLGKSPLTEYTRLVEFYLNENRISKEQFFSITDALFKNYVKTWKSLNPNNQEPEAKWFEYVTEYFRGVDCANPSVDFSGKLIFAREAALEKLGMPLEQIIEVLGCSLQQIGKDGPDYISEVISYKHMGDAFDETCEKAKVDFREMFLNNQAFLEVYTCYPVVPLAFFFATRFVDNIDELKEFLSKYEITITGGLNLGKAAWNCTTLGNIISMVYKLRESTSIKIGGVHGNASLGYQQAFLILSKCGNHQKQ